MKKTKIPLLFALPFVALISSCNNSNTNTEKPKGDTTENIKVAKLSEDSLRKIKVCTALLDKSHGLDSSKEAFGRPDLFWSEDKRTLNVQFLDGNPIVQQKVANTAKQWENYCGIKFIFGNNPNPDITISFKEIGSWSYLGKDSKLYASKGKPSMNYGWLESNTPQSEYDRVVLHEFGHALGLYHEHQNGKNNPIQWNKPVVYQYYMGPPNNWNKEDVDYNLFMRYSSDEYSGTSFDPLSIMQYSLPAEFTTDGYHLNEVYKLSETDKKFIASIYPK